MSKRSDMAGGLGFWPFLFALQLALSVDLLYVNICVDPRRWHETLLP